MKTLLILLAMIALTGGQIRAQEAPAQGSNPAGGSTAQENQSTSQDPNLTVEDTIDATESEEPPPQRKFTHFNEYEGPYFTGRFGAGFLVDMAAYAQDDDSKRQITLHPEPRLRDFRFILGGKILPRRKQKITWSLGIMYDGPNHQWLFRQTGVMIEAPKLWGNFFIGRTKEGFSLNKVMTGYDGWTMERSTMSDASIPILADGIKWLGYLPKPKILWNAGYFNDFASKGQSFSTYSSQAVLRLAWLPILSEKENKVLHLGVNLRFGKPVDDKLRLRSRPEAFPAPYFLDTGSFPSTSTRMLGYEVYYRPQRWLFGSEFWWVKVSSPTTNNPVVHGGDFVATYLFNDATRAYNTIGGYFRPVYPKRPVFEGGPGAWEAVLRYSYTDLNSKGIKGGTFARITPMVNWYLSNNVRLELAYGYGRLNRFDLIGNTQFFQSRVQLQF
jgi:phosphate-selective porin OprO and OprP